MSPEVRLGPNPSSAAFHAVGPEEIHVFVAFLDECRSDRLLEEYRRVVDPEELARASRFYFERDRHRFLVTRAMSRTLLSRYTGVPANELRFTSNAFGRPAIADQEEGALSVRFNISHSGGIVVFALAAGSDIGVDVEDMRAREAMVDIADRFFAPLEASSLRSLPAAERGRAFFRYWTLKESYIKARGMGLSLDLASFAFNLASGEAVGLELDPELSDRADRWSFWQFEIAGDYLLALCAERTGRQPQQVDFRKLVPLSAESELSPLCLAAPHSGECLRGAERKEHSC
jgi:4'-phosphopantetheinyl transferase